MKLSNLKLDESNAMVQGSSLPRGKSLHIKLRVTSSDQAFGSEEDWLAETDVFVERQQEVVNVNLKVGWGAIGYS